MVGSEAQIEAELNEIFAQGKDNVLEEIEKLVRDGLGRKIKDYILRQFYGVDLETTESLVSEYREGIKGYWEDAKKEKSVMSLYSFVSLWLLNQIERRVSANGFENPLALLKLLKLDVFPSWEEQVAIQRNNTRAVQKLEQDQREKRRVEMIDAMIKAGQRRS